MRPCCTALVSTHPFGGRRTAGSSRRIDPPEHYRAAAEACRNVGVWPVLVGEPGEHDTMLASPIILYDYPQIAPESPGDLFDGTEIDEILTLRIMTLTEEEQQAARGVDDRTRLCSSGPVPGPAATWPDCTGRCAACNRPPRRMFSSPRPTCGRCPERGRG